MTIDKLRVIASGLAPVYETSAGEKVVYGADLCYALDVKNNYLKWVMQRFEECDAVENEDFEAVEISTPSGQTMKEHLIKLDVAKKISMIEQLEQNKKGRQVLLYFIKVERKERQL